MNSLKGIRDDIEKSTLISKKVLGKIVELIGENTYQLLEDEHSDIITTSGELAICLHSLEYLEKENERLKQQIEKMKCCNNCAHYETTEDYISCRAKCVKIKNGQWILTKMGVSRMKTKKEDDKAQLEPRSYSKFEKCIMLLIAKFFSKEKDINKFGEWLEKHLKERED